MRSLVAAWAANRAQARASAIVVLLALAALAAPPAVLAATPRLVADFEPASPPYGSELPHSFLAAGSRVVYAAPDVEEPSALWASDGTAEGTRLLTVPCRECPLSPLASTGELAFFAAKGSYYTIRVWRSDGTVAGTYPVTPWLADYTFPPVAPAAARRYVYFQACDSQHGCGVWSSDGGAAVRLAEPLGAGFAEFRSSLIAIGEDVYFLANPAGGGGYGLFRASARTRTIELVRELAVRIPPSQLIAAGGRLFFFAAAEGRELWTSDGTKGGTAPLTAFRRREPMPESGLLVEAGGRAWFAAVDDTGEQLWSSDGTAAGTRRATALRGVSTSCELRFRAQHLAWVGGRLLFTVFQNGPKLWTTNGDWRSAAALKACPGGCPTVADAAFAPLGNRVVLASRETTPDGNTAMDPWISDGTAAGTRRIRDLEPLWLRAFTAANGLVFFEELHDYADDFVWVTDGTAGGTVRLGVGRSGDYAASDAAPYPLGAAGGRTYWAGRHGGDGALFATLGPADGAHLVVEPPVRSVSSGPRLVGAVGDRMLVSGCRGNTSHLWSVAPDGAVEEIVGADELGNCGALVQAPMLTSGGATFLAFAQLNGVSLPELWRTDGSAAGTMRLPLPGAGVPSAAVALHGEALFTMGFAGTNDLSLWSSDGTASGTRRVVDLLGVVAFGPGFVAAGEIAYFTGFAEAGGLQLWRTDGTGGGTFPLTVGASLSLDSYSLVVLGDRLYFIAAEIDCGGASAVWVSDGTVEGTHAALGAELYIQSVVDLAVAGGRLWFTASRGDLWTLWVSDGTVAGTRQLPAVPSWRPYGFDGDVPTRLAALGDTVYFSASDAEHGLELWRSDGTVEGTRPVVDLFPGAFDGAPLFLTAFGGRVWFSARTPQHGRELWSSDGTAAGTRLEADVSPGASWSSPRDLLAVGNRLYFNASDGVHGREPWVVDTTAPSLAGE